MASSYIKDKHDIGLIPASIDIGSAAIDRASTVALDVTCIDLANPANASGYITDIEIWAATAMTGCRVGTFFLVSGTTYECRDSTTIGVVAAGKQLFRGLSIEVQVGDFIGCYFATGTLEKDTTGGSGVMAVVGEYIDDGDSVSYSLLADDAISLYGVRTAVGLMLTQEKDGTPSYGVYDDEYLASQFFTGVPGYGSLPSEKEIASRQDDWRSGFGLEIYDSNDPKRYFSSIGMDMRFKGMALAGPIATAVHGTSGWRSPTSTTDTGADWVNDANVYDEDTTTCATTSFAGAGTSDYLEMNIVSTPCDNVRYFVGRQNVNLASIDLDVYYGAAWHNILSAAPTWDAWTTVAIGSTENVTAARIRMVAGGGPVDGYIYELDFDIDGNCALGNTSVFADFNDYIYLGRLTELWKVDKTAGTISYVRGFPANITDLEPFTDSNLYIALGTSTTFWYMSTAESFTLSTDATAKTFQFFSTVHTSAPTMYGNDSANTIRSTTNPANAGNNFSAITTVGSSYHSITGLLQKSGALYIMKEDMPYYLDSAGAVQNDLAPELASLTASTSGKNTQLWKNKLYIPCGDQSLFETDGTTNTFISPALYCTNLSDFVGRVQAVGFDEEYLYATVDNGTEVEVLAGHEETIDGTTGWIWHPICELTMTNCETAFVSTVYQKRLWVSSTVSTENLFYIPLPTGYGDITADANRTFQTDSYMITPWLHANFKDSTKAFIKITATLGHTYDAGIYFECWYQVVGDGTTWTDAGDFKGTATTRIATLYIPADSGGNKPSSTMVRFKFIAKTDSTTTTPILYSYSVQALLYPSQRSIIACRVRCSNELVLKDSTLDRGSFDTIVAILDEARAATWPVTFYDINGDTKYVKLLPLGTSAPRWTPTKREKGRVQERVYNLLLQEVTLS